MNERLNISEAELNSLLSAVIKTGGHKDLEKKISGAIESVHYGKADDPAVLTGLLEQIVRDATPPVIDAEWKEVWSIIFSSLIGMLLPSGSGPSAVIPYLCGPGRLPDEASAERVICLNPGSTSTKLALYRGIELEAEAEVHLPPENADSVSARTEAIFEWISKQGIGRDDLTGIACRGGFVKPVPTGTYRVTSEMVEDLEQPKISHASNMAIPIGLELAARIGSEDILITTTDPVGSDEMSTGARLTGIRKLLRDGTGAHYLNHNAVHALASGILGKPADELKTICAHMGGGMSIVRHSGGRVDDLVNAFSGVPSANRSGNIPLDILIEANDQGMMSIPELKTYLFGKGGLIDLAGTNDFRALLHFRDSGAVEAQRRKIDLVVDFMATNIAGSVMKLAAVDDRIDLVLLTGGLARSSEFTGKIKKKLLPYMPVVVVPGSIEHEAMVAGHMKARFRPETLKDYARERAELRKLRAAEKDLIDTEIFTHPQLRKRENAPVTSLDELIYLARTLVAKYRAPRIAIVGAENEEAIAAAKQANEEGLYPVAKFLLVGDYYKVNQLAWEYDIKVDGDNYTIVDAVDPVEKAVDLLSKGEADLLMKGGVKTSEIMRGALHYLKHSGRMRQGSVYSHVGIFQIPSYPKLLMVTDAALIPSPSQKIKKKILENALTVAGHLNITQPKIAVISAVEIASPSVESSMLAAELAGEYKDRTDCIVEGPLSLDVAMSPASAKEKHYMGRIKGNADILLMPDIEAGNVVYKSLTVSSGAYLAGSIVGAGVPIVLTSRGDSARSKLASICLACLVAMKQGDIIRRP